MFDYIFYAKRSYLKIRSVFFLFICLNMKTFIQNTRNMCLWKYFFYDGRKYKNLHLFEFKLDYLEYMKCIALCLFLTNNYNYKVLSLYLIFFNYLNVCRHTSNRKMIITQWLGACTELLSRRPIHKKKQVIVISLNLS